MSPIWAINNFQQGFSRADGTRFFSTTIDRRLSGALKMADDGGGRAMQTGWVRLFNKVLVN